MGKKYCCDICGKQIGSFQRVAFTEDNITINACSICSVRIQDSKKPRYRNDALSYLQEHWNNSSPAGKAFVEALIRKINMESQATAEDQSQCTETILPEEYKEPVSALLIGIVALLCLAGGVIATLVGIFNDRTGHEIFFYSGIGSIITSAFLFVIMNISFDIHHMEYLAKENQVLQKEIIRLLKEKE